ncbi:MAG TPA: SDR family oxidoreductase [Solirubrobacteraceae bacterium]|nr:SDR family oxidoreductase [Solirubrobacteraceae bacterium]
MTGDGALLLTGATGFVGTELLVRELQRGERHIYALIRAGSDEEATRRLHATLRGATSSGRGGCSSSLSTYISTAYVAGEHRGVFREGDLDAGQRFRNP